jgi:hypothetical protein
VHRPAGRTGQRTTLTRATSARPVMP